MSECQILPAPAERSTVLAARTRAVREQLAHYQAMQDLAIAHGERWGALATSELIRRHRQELTWLAELAELALLLGRNTGQDPPATNATTGGGAARRRAWQAR